MLTTETYVLEDAIDELKDHIATLDEALDELDSSTSEYERTESQKDRLAYFKNGLQWQRDEEGWSPGAEIELGAMTASEEAMMHRERPSTAEKDERRLWWVAASTVDAPYVGDDLAETFRNLGQCHPGFPKWAEAKANALGVPGAPGNSSEGETNSTTSSSSDSPTE
ncbi:hypothetical protein [Natrarchaeobius oligotrophus]|uniref:Uncharacterized protein n=1 Tax=Natrarchaeobius chitinivorans TaxID=1679083 RepID=A0A3N6LU24_NATCH|nr:hypothetical protein [Natrarchaeobius chitinivorans]RQG93728.1 hypothetical protein EA472_22605 [Natrarchaeobius chitinivorans]